MRFLSYAIFITSLVILTANGIPKFLIFNEEKNGGKKNDEDFNGIGVNKEWTEKLKQLRTSAVRISSPERSAMMGILPSLNEYEELFNKYVSLFQRSYINDEDEYWNRFYIFIDSLRRHQEMNRKEAMLNGTAIYGINKFSDWTPEEFQTILREQKATKLPIHSYPIVLQHKKVNYTAHLVKNTPPSVASHCTYQDKPHRSNVNWRSKLSRIKDQGKCGSCWAFVGSEQLETYWALKGNPVVELSPQELLSCSPSLGCEGGNTCAALTWLKGTGRVLETEQEYPYEGKDSKCRHQNDTRLGPQVRAVCGCTRLVGYENVMLKVVDQKGPLSVNVDAVLWHDYVGGIIQHHCTNKNMNHAVQLVGYSLNKAPVPYWLAKNQWGTSFGENGFIRIKYGDNLCGVAEQPSFIVL